MNSFNPLQAMMQIGQQTNQAANPLQQIMSMGTQRKQPIDPQKFTAAAQKLDKHTLANLVTQSRQQGIPDTEIEAGLNFLLKLR